ncbi:MAG: hypothetical protein K8R52_11340 [Bacteroidales bacterium]|nr:hypothetical protein [Bacteroidales bacterium]
MIKKSLRILTFVLFSSGCSIIFEEDLSEEIVYVNMPIDGTVSQDQSQLFWWEMVDGAIGYNLQIVEGTFSDPLFLVMDTNATGDKFLFDLLPGEYEWRINGWNNYSETGYFYNLLTITDTVTYEE